MSPSSTHPPAAASCSGNTPAPSPRMSAFRAPAKASVFQARKLLPRLTTSTPGNGIRGAGRPCSFRLQDNPTLTFLVHLPAVKIRVHPQSALQVQQVCFLWRRQKHRRRRAILQARQAAHQRKPRTRGMVCYFWYTRMQGIPAVAHPYRCRNVGLIRGYPSGSHQQNFQPYQYQYHTAKQFCFTLQPGTAFRSDKYACVAEDKSRHANNQTGNKRAYIK